MNRGTPAPTTPAAAGFTLAEVLVCTVLLSIGFVALLAAFGNNSTATQRGEDVAVATFLADEIRDMALQMPLANVLALNGIVYNPAVLSTGVSQNLSGWSQRIWVAQVSPADLNTAGTGAARVTVEVRRRGTPVVTQAYYVLDMNGVPFTDGGGN